MVRPKKYLGQHFLKDQHIAKKIVDALVLSSGQEKETVLEVGPGTGILTQYLLLKENIDLTVIEIDKESVAHLAKNFVQLENRILHADFLEIDLDTLIREKGSIIGNFPYNISSQIFFKVLAHYVKVDQVIGMVQKEVGERIAAKPGSKIYGILSVLLQVYYDIELLYKVPPGVFFPPPKVQSVVIRLKRNSRISLEVDEKLFKRVVKQAFQNRRKMLRNALKPLNLADWLYAQKIMEKRAEQLSIEDFIALTKQVEST